MGNESSKRLNHHISWGSITSLPTYSSGYRNTKEDWVQMIAEAGFDGIQLYSKDQSTLTQPYFWANLAKSFNLNLSLIGIFKKPSDLISIIEICNKLKPESLSLHVGTGMEDNDEAEKLIHEVLNLSTVLDIPVFVETHRATLTQDFYRTVQFAKKFPTLRFLVDFSHYYTGLEMAYGDFEAKLQFLQPIMQNAGFIHGRVGNSGCIQTPIIALDSIHINHFRALWKETFRQFFKNDLHHQIVFCPELLPAPGYAQIFQDKNGQWIENSDRWEQSLLLKKLVTECFEEAKKE